MRYLKIFIFLAIWMGVSEAQSLPAEIERAYQEGLIPRVEIIPTKGDDELFAEQAHGKCSVNVKLTDNGRWAGVVNFMRGISVDLNGASLFTLFHEHAHCLWNGRNGPLNFKVEGMAAEETEQWHNSLMHRSKGEIMLTEAFADHYAALLLAKFGFKETIPALGHLRIIDDSPFNVSGPALLLLNYNNIPSKKDDLFNLARKRASEEVMEKLKQPQKFTKVEMEELYLLWAEDNAQDNECWWCNRNLKHSDWLYQKYKNGPLPLTKKAAEEFSAAAESF